MFVLKGMYKAFRILLEMIDMIIHPFRTYRFLKFCIEQAVYEMRKETRPRKDVTPKATHKKGLMTGGRLLERQGSF